MTLLTRLLRLLTRTDQPSRDAELQRAKRTEKTIERYDQLVNATARQRQQMANEEPRGSEG